MEKIYCKDCRYRYSSYKDITDGTENPYGEPDKCNPYIHNRDFNCKYFELKPALKLKRWKFWKK